MTKLTFLMSLKDKLSGLPRKDIEEQLSFYSEMIEDRVEEGLSEEEAVAAVGSLEDIVNQIQAEMPQINSAEGKRHLTAWEIVLLVLGFPLWFPLLVAAFAVLLSLYVSWWAVIVSLWAIFVSVVASAFALILCGIGFAFTGMVLSGIGVLGAGLACAGFSVFMCYGCKAATKGTLILTGKVARGITNNGKGRQLNG